MVCRAGQSSSSHQQWQLSSLVVTGYKNAIHQQKILKDRAHVLLKSKLLLAQSTEALISAQTKHSSANVSRILALSQPRSHFNHDPELLTSIRRSATISINQINNRLYEGFAYECPNALVSSQ